MKIKLNKKLFSVLLAGSVTLTTLSGCKILGNNKKVNADNIEDKIGSVVIDDNSYDVLANDIELIKDNNTYESDYLVIPKDKEIVTEVISSLGETTTELNLRLGPSIDEKSIIVIPSNEEVSIISRINDWYLVKYNDHLGYVNSEYIKLMEYTVTNYYELEEDIIEMVPAIIPNTTVNIRSMASTDGDILGTINESNTLKMIRLLDNGWYEVIYDDETAYVCGDYVSETYMIDGEYTNIGYLNSDTSLFDREGNYLSDIPYLETVKIYDEVDEYYLVSTDNNEVGYINKSNVNILSGTFVIVDISSQTLRLYKDNEEILTSSIVSGKNSTPSDYGLFNIYSKEKDCYLIGADYKTFVYYWMPYNGGEGLHDATWRSSFGGNIYEENGSHGCVNLPLDVAEKIYNEVEVNDYVLVKR